MRLGTLLLVLLLVGCTRDAPGPAQVELPEGGGWATCPPRASVGFPHPIAWSETNDAMGRERGIHRLDARTFLFVWGHYVETLREDDITRLNNVDVARDGEGTVHVCARLDVATPVEVDAQPRTYDVAATLVAQQDLPAGPVRVTVNWVAGCSCPVVPMGNLTALFD